MTDSPKIASGGFREVIQLRVRWWPEVFIAILAVLLLAGILIPNYINSKERKLKAQLGEAYGELQYAIERYAADHTTKETLWVVYPKCLIGGSAPKEGAKASPDPLLRGGYLASYPKNPFAPMVNVKTIQERFNDPLRPGKPDSRFGCRFGEDYSLTGNVLGDIRFVEEHADFGYPFYDLWPEGLKKPKLYIPGAFFYRSCPSLTSVNSIAIPEEQASLSERSTFSSWWSQTAYAKMEPWTPTGGSDDYILGIYGPPNSKGLDVLGKPKNMVLRWESTGKEYVFNDPNIVTPYDENLTIEGPPFNENGIPDCIIRARGGPMDY